MFGGGGMPFHQRPQWFLTLFLKLLGKESGLPRLNEMDEDDANASRPIQH